MFDSYVFNSNNVSTNPFQGQHGITRLTFRRVVVLEKVTLNILRGFLGVLETLRLGPKFQT